MWNFISFAAVYTVDHAVFSILFKTWCRKFVKYARILEIWVVKPPNWRYSLYIWLPTCSISTCSTPYIIHRDLLLFPSSFTKHGKKWMVVYYYVDAYVEISCLMYEYTYVYQWFLFRTRQPEFGRAIAHKSFYPLKKPFLFTAKFTRVEVWLWLDFCRYSAPY